MTAPVFGQVSVITLAMVSYDQSPARTTLVARNDSEADLLSAVTSGLQYRIAGLQLDRQRYIGFSSNLFIKQITFSPRDWSQLVYKKSNQEGRPWIWTHVDAGYGQFYQLESNLGIKPGELEQPSSAYLRASFSF